MGHHNLWRGPGWVGGAGQWRGAGPVSCWIPMSDVGGVVYIPYHVKIGPHVIDKSPPIKSAEFDGRAQKYTAFAHGP